MGHPGWRPDLRRSLALFSAFRHEQDDPDRFYSALSYDSVEQLAQYIDPAGRTVVDVGGGPGHFGGDFVRRGATYLVVDPDPEELFARGAPRWPAIRGDGRRLPLRDGAIDICFSSNALEHVDRPEAMAAEMLRVTRPGGIVYVAYTNWLSPNGGHETGPWHLVLGGRRAADRYARRHGHRPKNDVGRTLYPLSAARMIRWARRQAAEGRVEVVACQPRYHPRGARWLIRLPGLRELLAWNVLLVLRRIGP